jgi:hypothetical protein
VPLSCWWINDLWIVEIVVEGAWERMMFVQSPARTKGNAGDYYATANLTVSTTSRRICSPVNGLIQEGWGKSVPLMICGEPNASRKGSNGSTSCLLVWEERRGEEKRGEKRWEGLEGRWCRATYFDKCLSLIQWTLEKENAWGDWGSEAMAYA